MNAEGIQCVGSKFVVYRHSETLAKKTGTAHPKTKSNPVRTGIQKRRAAAKAERERRNAFFREAAINAAREKRRNSKGDE